MAKVINLAGGRFGRLSVPPEADPVIIKRHAYWPCVCVCGRQILVRGSKLRSGRQVSCGCRKSDGTSQRERWDRMTPLQRRVLSERSHGKTLQQIADAIGISRQAVHQALRPQRTYSVRTGERCECGRYSLSYSAQIGHICGQ